MLNSKHKPQVKLINTRQKNPESIAITGSQGFKILSDKTLGFVRQKTGFNKKIRIDKDFGVCYDGFTAKIHHKREEKKAMSEVKISVRVESDLVDTIRARGDNVSEVIRALITREYGPSEVDEIIKKAGEETRVVEKTRGDFNYPVGDVICGMTNPQTQLWWCPQERLKQLTDKCKDWEESGGFLFRVGKEGLGSWFIPEVIESEAQERRQNGRFSPSCKGMNANVGDRLVWLEIKDPSKALEYMDKNTDIPCAVRCDVHKYSESKTYREAFNTANDLFVHYYLNGRPKKTSTGTISKSELDEMYDL